MAEQSAADLASFVEHMGGDRALRVEENLGQGYVRLRVGEAERRQAAHDIRCVEDIVIEMLRNARDAGAERIFVATAREGAKRTIVMLDDGSGVPQDMWEAIFDARVTSKLESAHMDRWGVHGRGMALFSIRENVEDAHVMTSTAGGGTAIRVAVDTEKLTEKTDQSSWPAMGRDEEGNTVIERGPHNIIRTCCEFALEERRRCEVYIGSPAEIVATARSRVRSGLSGADAMFVDDLGELAPLARFSMASDARELVAVAEGCGIEMSSRTAHRILAGSIRPVRSVVARLTHKGSPKTPHEVNLLTDRRGLQLSKDDRDEFLRAMERDFAFLAQRYYLSLSERPRLRISGNRLSVFFEYEGED